MCMCTSACWDYATNISAYAIMILISRMYYDSCRVIRAADPRSLRGATNAFLEAMELSLEVCEEFRLHPEEAATK